MDRDTIFNQEERQDDKDSYKKGTKKAYIKDETPLYKKLLILILIFLAPVISWFYINGSSYDNEEKELYSGLCFIMFPIKVLLHFILS